MNHRFRSHVWILFFCVQLVHGSPRAYHLTKGAQSVCLLGAWSGYDIRLEDLGPETRACLDGALVVMAENDPFTQLNIRQRNNFSRFMETAKTRDNIKGLGFAGKRLVQEVQAQPSLLKDFRVMKPEAAVVTAHSIYVDAFERRLWSMAARLGWNEPRRSRDQRPLILQDRILRKAMNAKKKIVALDERAGWRSDLDAYEGLVNRRDLSHVVSSLFVDEDSWDERIALALANIGRVTQSEGEARDRYLRGAGHSDLQDLEDHSDLILPLERLLQQGWEVGKRRRLRHQNWVPVIESELQDRGKAFVTVELAHLDDESFGRGTSLISQFRKRGFKVQRLDDGCANVLR